MAGGNLNIIITGDTSDGNPAVSCCKEDFDKKETEVILKLFKKELKDIEYIATIDRKAAEGGGDTLSICYEENKAEKARPALNDLRRKVLCIEQKSVDIPTEKKTKFADFVRKFESNPDILLLPDNAQNFVVIKGKSSESVEKTAHELKLSLGILQKSTNRVNRQYSTGDSKPSYASIVSKDVEGKSSNTSNIAKYKKGQRSFDRSPAQSADNSGSKSYNKSFSNSTSDSSYGAFANEDFDFKTELKNGFILKVYKASITSLDVDVIVNAANETMMHGGGVARVISDAAGYELDKQSRDQVERFGSVNVSDNIVTTAGKLHYKAVIHAVGPMWHDYKDKVKCLDDLYDCVYNILDTCKKKSFRRVAMSAISAGIFAVPKELCADMYVYAAANFSKIWQPSKCPKELHIIDVDTKILQLVVESVKRWQQDQESLNQRKTVPEYLKKNHYFSSHNTEGQRPSSRHRGHRHGGRGETSGSYNGDGVHGNVPRHTSPEQDDESPLKLTCEIRRLQDEKFKWGGIAKLFVLDTQLTVKLFKGEISKVRDMDAVVCGTGKDLRARGFIADALKKAGGHQYASSYEEMVRRHEHHHINSSHVFKCKGGELGSKYVLHAVVNRLVDANSKEIQEYQDCFENILKKVKRNEFRKLAIPLLGTGTLQTNKRKLKLCGKALLKALDNYLVKHGDKNEISEIHLINNSDIVTNALEEVFSEAADLKENGSNTKSKKSFDGNKPQSSTGERNYAGAGQDDRRGLSSHDWNLGRDGRNEKKEANARAEDKDTDSESDHYETICFVEPSQARHQDILNQGNERRSKKSVNNARAEDKDADSESDNYDTIDPVEPKQAKQQATPKPADSSSRGNLFIIES